MTKFKDIIIAVISFTLTVAAASVLSSMDSWTAMPLIIFSAILWIIVIWLTVRDYQKSRPMRKGHPAKAFIEEEWLTLPYYTTNDIPVTDVKNIEDDR